QIHPALEFELPLDDARRRGLTPLGAESERRPAGGARELERRAVLFRVAARGRQRPAVALVVGVAAREFERHRAATGIAAVGERAALPRRVLLLSTRQLFRRAALRVGGLDQVRSDRPVGLEPPQVPP